MKPILIIGTTIVNLALVFYSIAVITEQRKKVTNNMVMTFLTLGVIFDIIATICMVSGSTHGIITSHGLIGYSSLIAMLIDCVLLWKHRIQFGKDALVSKGKHLYTRFAYIWWIIAYISGAVIVAMRHMK